MPQAKISLSKDVGQQKVGSKSHNHLTNLQTTCETKYWIVSTVIVWDTVIKKIQRAQNSFIRLALCLPKYVSAHLLLEVLGLPYARETHYSRPEPLS